MFDKFKLIGAVCLSVFLSACTISASQIENLYGTAAPETPQNYYWQGSYGDDKYQLIAIEVPNGTLFADRIGNSLYFDGWSITAIVGFGEFPGEMEMEESEPGSFEPNAQNSLNLKNDCQEWQESQSGKGLIYTQMCGNSPAITNRIEVNSSGEIVQIKQHLAPSNKRFTLTKLY